MNRWANGDSLVIILTVVGTSQEAPASLGGGSRSLICKYYLRSANIIFYMQIIVFWDIFIYLVGLIGENYKSPELENSELHNSKIGES
jgi:hypothetical protein